MPCSDRRTLGLVLRWDVDRGKDVTRVEDMASKLAGSLGRRRATRERALTVYVEET